ncbi:hypothetical protein D3P04_09735 [Paracoccus onubensis]|uniref:Uncharacterized protein n=1 Tax=Paracoccus onubensis TaxID=1675788 RepID=A0A418SWK2_9RHOB|nr:hypothetical protein D3P04_09735 [Paracoccus onubensis]
MATIPLLLPLDACVDHGKSKVHAIGGPPVIAQLTATDRAVIEDRYKARIENRLKVILYNAKGAYFNIAAYC